MSLVLDASVALSWCLDEVQSAETLVVLQALETMPAFVPAIFPLEIANTLIVSERRKRVTPKRMARFVDDMRKLPFHVDATVIDLALGPVLDLARKHNMTAYDASYLELALRLRAPLATIDDGLLQAALSAGVGIFGT